MIFQCKLCDLTVFVCVYFRTKRLIQKNLEKIADYPPPPPAGNIFCNLLTDFSIVLPNSGKFGVNWNY